jgi:hypothetical protein
MDFKLGMPFAIWGHLVHLPKIHIHNTDIFFNEERKNLDYHPPMA